MGEVRRLIEDLSRLVEGDTGGVRHMVNEPAYVALEPGLKIGAPLKKKKRRVDEAERAFEQVRKKKFPDLPSRLNCLFLAETVVDAKRWQTIRDHNTETPGNVIYEVLVTGRAFVCDAELFSDFNFHPDRPEYIDYYWRGQGGGVPRAKSSAPWELLVDGKAYISKVISGPTSRAPR